MDWPIWRHSPASLHAWWDFTGMPGIVKLTSWVLLLGIFCIPRSILELCSTYNLIFSSFSFKLCEPNTLLSILPDAPGFVRFYSLTGRKSELLLPLRVRMCSLSSLWGLLPCVWVSRLISTQLRTPQGALSCPLPARASPGPGSIPPNQRDHWGILGYCSPKLSRGGRSGQKWGHLIRFAFLRDQGCAAWCLIDKNHCFIYFILGFSCFR